MSTQGQHGFDDGSPAAPWLPVGTHASSEMRSRSPANPAGRDLFMLACGARRPLQFAVQAPRQAPAIVPPFPQPFAVIGQDRRADVYLPHEEVSRRHVYVQVLSGRVFWVDLKSRTGVRCHGVRRDCGWLEPRDELAIGPYQVRLARQDHHGNPDAEPAEPAMPRLPASGPLPPVTITMRKADRPLETAQCSLERPLVLVGRSNYCQLQLVSTTVSRIHCALVRTALGVWAIDLLSQEGLLLNGIPLRAGRINEGDELRVGRFLLEFHYGQAARTATGHGWSPSNEAWVRVEPAAPQNAASPTHPDLVALVEQFGQMQHRMFDQFQQALMMMAQMLSSLHRDQIDLIRQEMNHLHELTQKLWTYQAELEKYQRGANAPPASAGEAAPTATKTVEAPPVPRPGFAISRSVPLPPAPQTSTPPEAEETKPEATTIPIPPVQPEVAPTSKSDPSLEDRPEPTTSEEPSLETEPPSLSKGDEVPDEPRSPQEVHAWLTRQIEAIQRERQSSWEKITSFFLRR